MGMAAVGAFVAGREMGKTRILVISPVAGLMVFVSRSVAVVTRTQAESNSDAVRRVINSF
jgi:hypothetical protein